MNVRQKLLSGLLVSGLISVGGETAFQAIARETEAAIPIPTQRSIDEYAKTCRGWQGQLSQFSRRHATGYGFFDFSDSRWAGQPVKEIDFWYICMRNIFQFEAGVEALGEELEEKCDRIGEDFQKNWVYFPQFTTISHEFSIEQIEGKMSFEQFAVYSCRMVVRPNVETSSESE